MQDLDSDTLELVATHTDLPAAMALVCRSFRLAVGRRPRRRLRLASVATVSLARFAAEHLRVPANALRAAAVEFGHWEVLEWALFEGGAVWPLQQQVLFGRGDEWQELQTRAAQRLCTTYTVRQLTGLLHVVGAAPRRRAVVATLCIAFRGTPSALRSRLARTFVADGGVALCLSELEGGAAQSDRCATALKLIELLVLQAPDDVCTARALRVLLQRVRIGDGTPSPSASSVRVRVAAVRALWAAVSPALGREAQGRLADAVGQGAVQAVSAVLVACSQQPGAYGYRSSWQNGFTDCCCVLCTLTHGAPASTRELAIGAVPSLVRHALSQPAATHSLRLPRVFTLLRTLSFGNENVSDAIAAELFASIADADTAEAGRRLAGHLARSNPSIAAALRRC